MVKARRLPAAESHSESQARRVQDIIGLCLFFFGAACLLWLAWPQTAIVPGFGGAALRLLAGSGAWGIPLLLMFIGAMFLVGYQRLNFTHATYGSLLLFLTFVTWRHVSMASGLSKGDPWDEPLVMHAGGYIGAVFGTIFLKLFAVVTSYLVLTLMACISVVLMVDRPFIELLRQYVHQPATAGLAVAKSGVAAVKGQGDRIVGKRGPKALTAGAEDEVDDEVEDDSGRKRRGLLSFRRGAAVEEEEEAAPRVIRGLPEPEEDVPAPKGRRAKEAVSANGAAAAPGTGEVELAVERSQPAAADFKLPPIALLKTAPSGGPKRSAQETADKIKVLEVTLEQFGIGADVVEVAQGPTVTRYEIQLAPGIKVSKIVSLADNLAMALAAIDVRVEAPIPGKSAIGVEVPNSAPAMVTLRECIDTPEFWNAPSKITFALGKDVSGQVKYADLTKMPHLLIGGSTNSGKSVCLNTLIASMLYRATPRELKFIMIDPKRVELSLWDGIPHLMHPVVKDVKQAAGIFRAALKEMERRYDLFSRLGTRNIDGYNQRVAEEEKLPYLVIVVDELADLMMQQGPEIETSICRIAQLARATGIHLVIATQRPSVDVITGLIKANISSRIAFAVASQVDSRTVLDMTGAERLIGRGDMLFLPIDASKPLRIQGCYLSEGETNALVAYLKEQEKPNYSIIPMEVGGPGGPGPNEAYEDEDDFYEAAVKLVVMNGQASTSMLQRRFKIGYTRAARLVDMMEQRGIVGPLDGAKPREILVSKDEIDRMFGGYGSEEPE